MNGIRSFYNAHDIGVKALSYVFRYKRVSFFGAEDEMNDVMRKGLGHIVSFAPPLWGYSDILYTYYPRVVTLGFRRTPLWGWGILRPLAAA